ncbi:hypothetical protein FKP32DRAFT_281034 [Trametes sanguinea]|nr:hypothetical protein FKP32DRAFT_281034 [Trametes sanguinea]
MYRGVSIPAWTVLREPSEASGAPSEDELESRLSSEMVDEIAPTPQPPARRPPSQTQRPNMVTPSSQSAQRPAFVEGSSTGSQASSSSVPRNPPSPLFTRRPLSDSGSDGEPRPPKKKKKRILNPEQGPATARTRVPLDGQPPADDTPPIRLSQLASNMFPPTLKSSEALREARRKRRVTMDVGILAHQSSQPSGSQAERRHARRSDATGTLPASQKSIPSLPRSNANTPLQQAQARRKSTNARGRDGHPSTGQRAPGPSSQRPPPTSAAPPSPEVIEILDSDDEPPPPPPRKAPAKPPAPPPPLNIPRRTKYQPNPLPQYKEENGVIILTSDDDESAAPPKSKTPAPSTPSIPEKGSQEAEVQNRAQVSSQRPAATSPLRASENPGDRNPQSAVSLQMATEDEVAARVTPPPADMLDVEMTEEDPALPEMSEEIPEEIPANADPSVADAQLMDDMAAPQESPPGDPPDPSSVVTQEDPPSSGMVPPDPPEGHAEEDVDTRASPPVDEPPVRTSLSVEPPAATEVLANPDPIQRTSPPLLPTQGSDGTSPADQGLPEKLPPLSGPVPPSPPDQVPVPSISSLAIASRSETASPVSSMLDPQLQELAISGTPTGNDQSAHQTPSSSVQQSVPSKPPSSSSSSSSTAWSSSSSSQSSRKAPKIRIKAALYSGPDGFFADVYRHSQKRRQSQTPSSSQSRPAASPSTSLLAFARDSSRVAATISPEAVKLTDTNSPPALQESSVMSKQQPAIPVEVQEEPQLSAVEERNEVPGLVMQAEMTGSLLTKPSLEEPCQLVTSSQVVEEPQNASLHEDQPMEEDGALAPASPTGIRASPPEQQGPTAAFEPVQPETPSDHRPAQPQPSSNAAAVEDPRIAEECGEARALQVSLPSSGINTARGDTPPVENQPDNDPRTLSQIILKAVSEKARQDIVDLTLEDSDNDAAQGDKPGMSEFYKWYRYHNRCTCDTISLTSV